MLSEYSRRFQGDRLEGDREAIEPLSEEVQKVVEARLYDLVYYNQLDNPDNSWPPTREEYLDYLDNAVAWEVKSMRKTLLAVRRNHEDQTALFERVIPAIFNYEAFRARCEAMDQPGKKKSRSK